MKLIQIIFLRLKAITGKIWLVLFLFIALTFSFFVVDTITSPAEVTSLQIAVVDMDNSPLSQSLVSSLASLEGLTIWELDVDAASLLLARGRVEGVFVIDHGYEEALLGGDERVLPIRYESAATVATRTAAREMIAGQVISQRSLLRAKGELYTAGVSFSEEELENIMIRFNENTPPLYSFTVFSPGLSPEDFRPTGMFGGYLGFISLVIILVMMTLSQWFAKQDSRSVTTRMRILRGGRALSFFGDTLLLLGVGFVIVLLAYLGSWLAKTTSTFVPSTLLSGLEIIYLLAYVYCITGLCLILSRFQEAGSIDIMAPLIALFTSILGGSFMDLASLSPVMQALSLFTPQGQLLYGINHGTFWNIWVLLGIGSLFLILVYDRQAKAKD